MTGLDKDLLVCGRSLHHHCGIRGSRLWLHLDLLPAAWAAWLPLLLDGRGLSEGDYCPAVHQIRVVMRCKGGTPLVIRRTEACLMGSRGRLAARLCCWHASRNIIVYDGEGGPSDDVRQLLQCQNI